MAVTDLAGANIGLRNRASRFPASPVIELVGRFHLAIFHQSRIIPQGIALRIKLLPSVNQFVSICPTLAGQNAVQEQFKVVSQDVFFYHLHKEVSRCGRTFDSQAAAGEKYKDTLFESSSQTPHYPCERYNPRLRRDIRWHAAGPRHCWPGVRRKFLGPLQPETFQFLFVQRESYRNALQWNANAPLWLYH